MKLKAWMGKLFVAFFVTGALAGQARRAWAVACPCMPATQIRAYHGSLFHGLGGILGYQMALPTDFYGFNAAAAPSVNLDVYFAGASSIESEVCRYAYTGTQVACSGLVYNTGCNQFVDIPERVTGVYGASLSPFDYVFISYVIYDGIGTIIPQGVDVVGQLGI
jgi:hypothetical protein